MDEARAMLDELMGKTRDLTDDVKRSVRQVRFSDREVCKDFLCGLCPHIVFTTTKSDLGKCPYQVCGKDPYVLFLYFLPERLTVIFAP